MLWKFGKHDVVPILRDAFGGLLEGIPWAKQFALDTNGDGYVTLTS